MKYLALLLSPLLLLLQNNLPETDPSPLSAITKIRNDYPQEKVYLQTDRNQYFAGETIWLKAWCTLDGTPSYLSRIIYVSVADEMGKVVSKKMYKLDSLGSVAGAIDIPVSLSSGNYSISAYSLWMLNFPEYVFHKDVFIYNSDYKTQANKSKPKLVAKFFPEGGELVAGVKNRVAFKLNDSNGFPINISGTITDKAGKKLADFSPEHDGLGAVDMEPVAGEVYTANIPFGSGSTQQIKLPQVKDEGISLRVENGSRVTILLDRAEKNKANYNKLKLFAQMHYQKVFSADINFDEGQSAASFSKKNLPPGILQVTVFNEQNQPLAERIVFIENYEVQQPEVKFDTLSLKPKGKNIISFSLADNTPSSLSLAITNGQLDNQLYKDESLASALLATSELRGYINNPGYYFKDKSATTLRHLDLLLMTQGWRRFDWKKVLAGSYPQLNYPVESSISLSGKVTKSDRTESIKEGKVSFIIRGEDSTTILADAMVTDKGEFLLSDLDFRKLAKVSFQGTNAKKENLIVDVKLNPAYIDSLARSTFKPDANLDTLDLNNRKNELAAYLYSKYAMLDTGKLGGVNFLGNVTVKARRVSREDSLNMEYATGVFQMGKGISPEDYKNYTTIWQIMAASVPGIRVEGNPFDPEVFYSRFAGLNNALGAGPGADENTVNEFGNMEENGITYFLNEINVAKDIINTISVTDIALIKVYKNEGAALGAREGAIAIYTKKGMPARKDITEKTFSTITKEGYAVSKEFYAPDYEINPNLYNTETDKRYTLYWSGKLKPNKDGKYRVKFFNNDVSNKYKIILQGLDKEGKLIQIEKLVQ